MTLDEQIENIIAQSINIIDREITKIQHKKTLQKLDSDKVVEFLKTLVIISKDKRQGVKESILDIKNLTREELDQAIADEINKNVKTG